MVRPGLDDAMIAFRVLLLTILTMIAFAANSLLCRLALKSASIDAATFTSIRLASGVGVLYLLVRTRGNRMSMRGDWLSAVALFAYAAAFSFAYLSLPAGTGALLLYEMARCWAPFKAPGSPWRLPGLSGSYGRESRRPRFLARR